MKSNPFFMVGNIIISLFLVGCVVNHEQQPAQTEKNATEIKIIKRDLTIPLLAKNDSKVNGEVKVKQSADGNVVLHLKAQEVSPGLHAIHIHENPDCSSVDGSSAGAHWNPLHQAHGKWGAKNGFHQGDIGVFLADKNGQVDYTFKTTTENWCIGCGDSTKDILEHSIILHAKPDDFKTQPTGDAGARVACGIIR